LKVPLSTQRRNAMLKARKKDEKSNKKAAPKKPEPKKPEPPKTDDKTPGSYFSRPAE